MKPTAPSLLGLAFLAMACATSQAATSPTPTPTQAAGQRSDRQEGPKDYQDVITDAAVSDEGLFTVHMVDGKLYFEIPDSLLERDMLLISRIAQAPADMGGFVNAGSKVAEQVLRWQRRQDQILIRKVSYSNVLSSGCMPAMP